MTNNDNYEYVDEEAISDELKCSICQAPFKDPRITECEHTFCNICITDWMRNGNGSCPIDRRTISKLAHVSRPLRNLLDNLEVKCQMCGQRRIKRSDFANHVRNECTNTDVVCLAADIECKWAGPRHELNEHMRRCKFQQMRHILDPLIMENEHLKQQLTDNNTRIQTLSNDAADRDRHRANVLRLQTENNELNERLRQSNAQNEELRRNARGQQSFDVVRQPPTSKIRWYNTTRSCVIHTCITISLLVIVTVLSSLLRKQPSSPISKDKLPYGSCFASQVTYTAGSYPVGLAVADVNSDGKPDIMITNLNSNNVGVFINAGGGAFLAQTVYAAGASPHSMVAVDVNSDGKTDIVATNAESNNVGVFLNTGSGTFLAQSTYSTGSSPLSFSVIDVNSDGKPDIIVPSASTGTVGVLLNTGIGAFSTQTTYAVGAVPNTAVAVDVNNDGKPDIVVSNTHSNSVGVLLNTGNGTFSAQTTYPTGTRPFYLTVADVNLDGRPDIVVPNAGSNNVGVFINGGSGIFLSQVTYAVGSAPGSVAIADVNGDGISDIVVTNSASSTVGILLNTGNGTFLSQITYATGLHPHYVEVVDVNSDGKADLIVTNSGSNSISVLLHG